MSEFNSPLPVKNGISPNKIWLPQGEWQTVFEFFRHRFPQLSGANCAQRFASGEVRFSDGSIVDSNTSYRSNAHLFFYREVLNELIVPFEESIVFENENIIVAEKPHFLPVAPTGQYLKHTLLVRLRNKLKNDHLELCHRLDRETAGLVLLTKHEQVRAAYHSLFSERKITKVYHARAKVLDVKFPIERFTCIVKGEPYMRMKEVDGEENSRTFIELIHQNKQSCLYRLQPITGKKHQLRVHMSGLNIPIINDPLYPIMTSKPADDFDNPLQLLAKELSFIDPIDGQSHHFISSQDL
ncbi:MAG: pseudouridine synthase [Kangiellaceae bacterium]|nr:pseudouridine synthase [Kangiellaceae bacterium]